MSGVKSVSAASFDNEIATNEQVIVEFGASWCQPCKAMIPILEKVAAKGMPVLLVDIDDSTAIAKRFNIRGAPTFIAFWSGKEIGRVSGMQTDTVLMRLFAR